MAIRGDIQDTLIHCQSYDHGKDQCRNEFETPKELCEGWQSGTVKKGNGLGGEKAKHKDENSNWSFSRSVNGHQQYYDGLLEIISVVA
ncbi:MAG: hypothetical protein Q9212_003683 [Teloschistes hypoglaucus]